MSLFNSFDRDKHFSELASPLATAGGVLTPQARRAKVMANLGMVLASSGTGVGAARFPTPAPATATDTATLTTAQIANGFLIGTPTAAAAYTLPTGTAFETALAALGIVLGVDEGFDFTVLNTSGGAFTITMTTAAGWTLVGPMTIAQNVAGTFRVRKTATNAYTLYRISV